MDTITSLEKERDEKISEIKTYYDEKILRLREEEILEKSKKYEAGKIDFDDLKTTDLESLSIIQLQYIIYSVLGPDATYRLRHWEVSVFSRTSCRGDITFFELDDAQYKRLLCKYITLEMSCTYCKSITHRRDTCS